MNLIELVVAAQYM